VELVGVSGRKTGVTKLSTKEELLKIVVLHKEVITTKLSGNEFKIQ